MNLLVVAVLSFIVGATAHPSVLHELEPYWGAMEFGGILALVMVLVAIFVNIFISRSGGASEIEQPLHTATMIGKSGASEESKDKVNEDVLFARSYHEAAHTIGHRLYGETLTNSEVWVTDEKKAGRFVAGNSAYQASGDMAHRTTNHIERVIAILPFAAEKAVRNVELEGSDSDFASWERLARHLLNSFPGKMPWFHNPVNAAEAVVNAETIKSMRASDLEIATKYAEDNAEIIVELANELMDKKRMEFDDVKKYLGKLTVDKSMPQIAEKGSK